MNRVEQAKAHIQEANLENNIFRLTPAVQSSTSSFLPVQLNLGSLIREIKKNQNQFFGFSTQGTTLSQMFSKGAYKRVPILKQSQIGCMDNSRKNSFELKERLSPLSIKQQEASEISAAYPDINICNICKERFQNYFKHISSNKHKKNQKGGCLYGQQNISMELVVSELISSVNQVSPYSEALKKASDRSQMRKKALRVTDKVEEDFEDEDQPCKLRKIRVLSNGMQVSIKSSLSTGIMNQISLPRKGSFFS